MWGINTIRVLYIIYTFSVIHQGTFTSDVEECKQICNSNSGCHGYVYINDVAENETNLRNKCYQKFGNVFINGTHSQKTTANYRLL